jgi:hypothetical protein
MQTHPDNSSNKLGQLILPHSLELSHPCAIRGGVLAFSQILSAQTARNWLVGPPQSHLP